MSKISAAYEGGSVRRPRLEKEIDGGQKIFLLVLRKCALDAEYPETRLIR
jgi:hypothetical protein